VSNKLKNLIYVIICALEFSPSVIVLYGAEASQLKHEDERKEYQIKYKHGFGMVLIYAHHHFNTVVEAFKHVM
jgi:hypothetical protein